jgi:hypothetical protein
VRRHFGLEPFQLDAIDRDCPESQAVTGTKLLTANPHLVHERPEPTVVILNRQHRAIAKYRRVLA